MSWMEVFPFVGGLIAAVAGGALVGDAVLAEDPFYGERRRSARAHRNRVGQGLLGVSLVCTAIVLLSGGASPFDVTLTFVGVALLAAGMVLNRRYLWERITGPSRRGELASVSAGAAAADGLHTAIPSSAAPPGYGWPLTSDE